MERNVDDSKSSLLEIAGRNGQSIISLMLDIQKCKVAEKKVLKVLEQLACLWRSGKSTWFTRRWINAFSERNFVAVSYTWDASKTEESESGRYRVQTRNGARFYSSKVRDCVFDRVVGYMNHFQLDLFWIDNHGIKQQSCGQPKCNHLECDQKNDTLRAMDLVYKLSEHPIALLGKPMVSGLELELLAKLLSGTLVSQSRHARKFKISETSNRREASEALLLLKNITSDLWWTRGWIFQESYRGGAAMNLLISHHASLEKRKLSCRGEIFHDIPGELCINSVTFSYEATRLCLAFQGIQPQTAGEKEAINCVLTTAGRYSILLARHESMSPSILSDIENRNVGVLWDRLDIVANCCQYPIRLDSDRLQQKRHSISLSILTMCLLNGEILDNTRIDGLLSQKTVSESLKDLSFKSFYAPMGKRNLSFNKGCRFIHVKLEAAGIWTKGHVWKLSRLIRSHDINRRSSWVKEPSGNLALHERKRLQQLTNTLRDFGYECLGNRVQDYLRQDSLSNIDHNSLYETFSENYMRTMASELVHAIDHGVSLKLGCLWDPSRQSSSYKAIFIWDHDEQERGNRNSYKLGAREEEGSAFVFTASRPESQPSNGYDANDLDHHVSIEVELMGSSRYAYDAAPRLFVKRWRLGLCFFEDCPRTDVVFPWPPGLQSI